MKFEKPGAKAPSNYGDVVSQGLKTLLPRLKSEAPTASSYVEEHEGNAFADAIDRAVESLVSGEPSPHFNSRLRARIAAEAAAPRIPWRTLAPIAATLTALAVVVAVFMLRTHRTISATAGNPEVAVNSTAPPASINAALAVGSGERTLPVANRPAALAHRRSHLAHITPSQPEVIVDPGELAAAIQFADAIRSGRIDGPKLVAAEQQVAAPIEIKPLEIAPLSPPDPPIPVAPNTRRP